MPRKIRLDLHMLTKGFVDSRQQAQILIRAGKVRDAFGCLLDKPGQLVPCDLKLQIKAQSRFVSRGGEKLLAALNAFPVKIAERVCLDGGISTGGFTDCLLQHGASRIYGVDVGYGQTAWSLRQNPKLVLKERTNLRYLESKDLLGINDPSPTLAVADLSFISLKIVLPAIKSLLSKDEKECILLVKPQFEVGREKVGKGGVVRSVEDHIYALNEVINFSKSLGLFSNGVIASPITGPAGNHEYLLWLRTCQPKLQPQIKSIVEKTLLKS